MRVLVTGGAGFLGSHLCERLVLEGHDVVSLDDYSTGHARNLDDLRGRAQFTECRGDVRDEIDIGVVDRIFHLACPASPSSYQSDPVGTTRTAVLGALNSLEAAKRHGARILFASTSEIYGEPEVHPQPESYVGHVNPVGPRACYVEGKRVGETLCFDYARTADLVVKVARIFNTYGPRMSGDGRVVSNFIARAQRGEPITIYGDGSQTRSFCYVADLVEALVRFMESEKDVAGPMNLGNDEEVTIVALAKAVLRLTGGRARLRYEPRRCDDPSRRCPDIHLARGQLGWAPEVALEEGLARTLAAMS